MTVGLRSTEIDARSPGTRDWVGSLIEQSVVLKKHSVAVTPSCFAPIGSISRGTLSRFLAVLCILVLAAWTALISLGLHQPMSVDYSLGRLARSLAAAAFLTAGAMNCATWRLAGDARAAWRATALIVIGLTLPLISAARRLPSSHGSSVDPALAVHLLMVFTVMSLWAFTLMRRPVNMGLRPLKIVAPLVLGLAIATMVLVFQGQPVGALSPVRMDTYRVAGWTATAMWVVLACAQWRMSRGLVSRRQNRTLQLWGAAGLSLMAVTELLTTVALDGHSWLVELSAGFQLLASAIVACAAATRLWAAFAAADTCALELTGDLVLVRADLIESQRRDSERLHDARTAVVSLTGASRLLHNPDLSTKVDRDQLHRLITAELRRLEMLLHPEIEPTVGPFRLAEAVESLVLAHRIAGEDVRLELDDGWAIGQVDETASAVANLLSNARIHAPGAAISVTATSSGQNATIRVEDDGPGIPVGERRQMLTRGACGETAVEPGSGLGLYTAAHAMSHQGGSLALSERIGGGTTVLLTLGAAHMPGPSGAELPATSPNPPRFPTRPAVHGG